MSPKGAKYICTFPSGCIVYGMYPDHVTSLSYKHSYMRKKVLTSHLFYSYLFVCTVQMFVKDVNKRPLKNISVICSKLRDV